MRLIGAFALSFLFTAVLGVVLFPTPPVKPAPAKFGVVRPSAAPANPFELLPPPSSSVKPIASSAELYEAARQMVATGRLHAAQRQYLQILLASPSIDSEAMQGLTRVQGLLARGNPAILQQQADVYRQTIARGDDTEEHYSPRALELLAEANILAAQEVMAGEVSGGTTPVALNVPEVSGIPQHENTLRAPAPARGQAPVAPPAVVQQVVRLGSLLNPGSSAPQVAPEEPLAPSEPHRSIAIPVVVPASPGAGATAGASAPGGGSTPAGGSASSWGSPGAGGGSSWGGASGGSGRTGSSNSWGNESGPQSNR